MKKISLLIFSVFFGAMAFAQTRGLNVVSYRGAFDPSDSMWTKNWTNFDPQNAVYNAPTVQVTGYIQSNTTWKASKVYQLNGPVMVINGATLTIEAGTVIRGNALSSNSSLIITRGAKIMAMGTEAKPIVFTSSKAAGLRASGDWGGVIIMGNAKINPVAGQANIEGLEATSNSFYGGSNDNDNSGVFQYARIEFGGYIFSANNEINGLTMGGVGNQTTIHHVQCSFIKDDAFEWFGGNVNCSHLVAYRCTDDDFDTDFGFSGSVQFCLGIRDKDNSDAVSGGESNGFESDNDATGSTAKPYTRAIFSNVTLVGPYRYNSVGTPNTLTTGGLNNKRAVFIRRNSNLRVVNSVFTDYKSSMHIKDNSTIGAYNADSSYANNNDSSNMCLKNCVFAAMNTGATNNGVEALFTNSANLWTIHGNSYQSTTANLFVDDITNNNYNMDYRPKSGSPIATGADFTNIFAASRTRIGPGLLELTVETLEIGNTISKDTVVLTANNLTNASTYTWTVPTGVNIITGQGTRTLKVFFLTTTKTASKIYCIAYNAPSRIFSNKDSIVLTKTKPTYKIVNLTNSSSQVYSSAPGATNLLNVITVASTTGLTEGSVVVVTAGTGTFKTNTTVLKVINATSFVVSAAPTAALSGSAVVSAFVNNSNLCGIIPNSGTSAPVSYKVYAPAAANIVGYTFVAPAGSLIRSVGSVVLPTPSASWSSFDSTRTGKIIDSITVVFDAAFIKGNLTVTPYNVAGTGTKFTLALSKVLPLLFKVTGSAATASSTVTYTAVMGNGTTAASYEWTIPTSKVTITHGAAAGTIVGNVITTTVDTLTLSFASNFTTGSLKVKPVNACGNGVLKSFILNGTALTKNGASSDLEEITSDLSVEGFNLFPNPNTGNFSLNMIAENTEAAATVTIINAMGQVVSTVNVDNNNGIISADLNNNLEQGIYFVRVVVGSEVKLVKISVQK